MRKTYIYVSSCAIISILVVLILTLYSKNALHSDNGFIRIFPPHGIRAVKEIKLPSNNYYFAGIDKSAIYIGNELDPGMIYNTDHQLPSLHNQKLDIPKNVKLFWKAIRVYIDSTTLYSTEVLTPSFSFSPLSGGPREFRKLNGFHFDQVVPISSESIIVRTYDTKRKQNVLKKITFNKNTKYTNEFTLEKQLDGIFCVDGMMKYDPVSARLLYMYYYRNRYLVLDTNLKLIYGGKTRDTTNKVEIKVADYKVNSRREVAMSAPPKQVNLKSCLSGDYIFIESALKADNETKEVFTKHWVVDIFNLNNGRYHRSFYLPKYNDEKVTEFSVYRDQIFVRYGSHLKSFKFKF